MPSFRSSRGKIYNWREPGFLKICPNCSIAKDADSFYKRNGGSCLRTPCRECSYARNKQRDKAAAALYRASHKEEQKLMASKWRNENNARYKEKSHDYYMRTKESRRALRNAGTGNRRAARINATPTWADREKIKQLYIDAKRLRDETGVDWHVDHIIPLRSKIVCGLHVENNLQVISAKENMVKKNKYSPEEVQCRP